ncbi:MAG: DUF1573 domain-containing protein [Flavobacteriales bacterium]
MIHFDAINPSDAQRPEAFFPDPTWDLGTVAEGSTFDHFFVMKNTGNAPLVLADVSATCGCTVARNWPKTPIAPGEEIEIELTYDSRGRQGEIDSKVLVVANTYPSTTQLQLIGRVIGPEENHVIQK